MNLPIVLRNEARDEFDQAADWRIKGDRAYKRAGVKRG